jgi:hypothetical protein
MPSTIGRYRRRSFPTVKLRRPGASSPRLRPISGIRARASVFSLNILAKRTAAAGLWSSRWSRISSRSRSACSVRSMRAVSSPLDSWPSGFLPGPTSHPCRGGDLSAVGLLDPDSDELSQLFKLQLSELVPLFQQTEGLTHHFARRKIPAALDLGLLLPRFAPRLKPGRHDPLANGAASRTRHTLLLGADPLGHAAALPSNKPAARFVQARGADYGPKTKAPRASFV